MEPSNLVYIPKAFKLKAAETSSFQHLFKRIIVEDEKFELNERNIAVNTALSHSN